MISINIFCSNQIDWNAVSAIAGCIYTLVAIIGTYFVIRSFRQQAAINRNQLSINEHQLELFEQQKSLNLINLQRHIRAIRPTFSYQEKGDLLEFSLKNAIAKDINVWIFDKDEKMIQHLVENKIGVPNSFLFEVDQTLSHKIEESKKTFILIKFSDEDDRIYCQKVFNNPELGIQWPRILSEDKTYQEIINDHN